MHMCVEIWLCPGVMPWTKQVISKIPTCGENRDDPSPVHAFTQKMTVIPAYVALMR